MKLKFTLLMSFLCFALFAKAQINVALNKQVVASVGNTGGFSASEAIDGNTESRWGTPSEDGPHWIYVDLGAVYNISQIKIDWEAAKASAYEIQTSNDATSWTKQIDGTNPTGLEQHRINDFTGLNFSARYVRIYCTARSSAYGYSIFELEVYSSDTPANLAPKVNLISPANNATYATPGTIPLEATASDSDGSIAKVEFYNGTTKIGEATSAPYAYTWSNVAGGNYTITAVATDDDGVAAISAPINIKVELPVIVPQCGGLGKDSDYTYKFSWDSTNPTITFIPNPNRPTVGAPTLILYYNTTGINDGFPGYTIQPNVPYKLNATNGQTVYFYFTYSGPDGPEKNNADNKHQFVIGSCNSSINLALNQPITASSVVNTGDGAKATNANDGNAGTRWESAHGGGQNDVQWIYVDLGDNYDLTGVNILWENAKADEYIIQTSTNATAWIDILTVTGNTTEPNQRTHAVSGTGRYVRVYGTKKTTEFAPYGYSIFELEVYGTPNTGTLPVSLISFNSKLENNGSVNLTWATAAEQNNSYFLLERSADGKNFAPLQKIASKGNNSQTRLDYQFTDVTPLNGNNYYRLSQVDLNGNSKIVGYTSQQVSLNAQSLVISPNPLSGNQLTLNLGNAKTTTAKVVISSIHGVILYNQVVNVSNGIAQVSLANKPVAGIYLVKVADLPAQKLIIK